MLSLFAGFNQFQNCLRLIILGHRQQLVGKQLIFFIERGDVLGLAVEVVGEVRRKAGLGEAHVEQVGEAVAEQAVESQSVTPTTQVRPSIDPSRNQFALAAPRLVTIAAAKRHNRHTGGSAVAKDRLDLG